MFNNITIADVAENVANRIKENPTPADILKLRTGIRRILKGCGVNIEGDMIISNNHLLAAVTGLKQFNDSTIETLTDVIIELSQQQKKA